MKLNEWIDQLNEFLSARRGLLPLIGILLIIINFVLQLIPLGDIWLVSSNLFLHVGLIVALLGILLIQPLQ